MNPQKKRKREETDRDTVSGPLYAWFVHNLILFDLTRGGRKTKNPGKRPQTVCVRSVSRKSRDLDALGSREVMAVMK